LRAGFARIESCPPFRCLAFGCFGRLHLPASPPAASFGRGSPFCLVRPQPLFAFGVSRFDGVSTAGRYPAKVVGVLGRRNLPAKSVFGVVVPLLGFFLAWAAAGCLVGFRALPAGRFCQVFHGFAGFRVPGSAFFGFVHLPAVVGAGLALVKVGYTCPQAKKSGCGSAGLARVAKGHCPTSFAADGRGLSPRPRGFSPESVVRPLAFSRQIPRPPLKPAVGQSVC